jgi:hypothetical protein
MSTHQNTYAYKLDGFDKEWNYIDTKREVTYTNLDAGNYTFYAKGANSDRIWNETPISVNITIIPPWWKTWLFKTFLVLSIFTLLIALINLRLRSFKYNQVLLEKKVNQRTTVIR